MKNSPFDASQESEERLVGFKPIQLSDEQRHRDRIDGLKLFFELLKHVTTLATGSIVVVATFVDRVFREPKFKVFFGASLICFLVALALAVIGMLGFAARIRLSNPMYREDSREIGALNAAIAMTAFVTGAVSLALFTFLNFLD